MIIYRLLFVLLFLTCWSDRSLALGLPRAVSYMAALRDDRSGGGGGGIAIPMKGFKPLAEIEFMKWLLLLFYAPISTCIDSPLNI